MKKKVLFFWLLTSQVFGQSPTDLTSNINLPASVVYTNSSSGAPVFGTVAQIAAAFDYGRRQEEIQAGLAVNSLGNLVLPSAFSTWTPAQQALYLINQERTARAGLSYPSSANVLGFPLEGLETNLSGIALGHATDMTSNGFFGHIGTDGRNPYERIADSPVFAAPCSNAAFAYSENIYSSCTYSSVPPVAGDPPPAVPFLTAQAIYTWVYRDAGSGWGHRRAIMIQNTDPYLSGTTGYVNDHGSSGSEGFLGIATASVVDFAGCSSIQGFYKTGGHVVVLNIADPSANTSCTFDVSQDPLPVDLVSFRGESKNGQTNLYWKTASEINNAGFEIETSLNAKTWAKTGFVEGSVSSETARSYTFTDPGPYFFGSVYYRLKQIDRDGKFSYSRIVSVDFGDVGDALLVYPNPASATSIHLSYPYPEQCSFALHDLLGKQYTLNGSYNNQKGVVVLKADTMLPTGLYSIGVRDAARGLYITKKIMIK